jgi:ribose-phosphate pyrophosphokinase
MSEESILILADPNGKAWDFANKIYYKLKLNENSKREYLLGKVEITKFNDGEIFVKVLENVRKKTCYFIHDSSMLPQDWIVSLALINCALMRSSAGKINNVLPYMKYSRQDRMSEPRTPISAKVVADIINLRAYRVITTDMHNPATMANYNIPFDNLKAYPVIINHLNKNYPDFLKNAIIVSPDIGSAPRAESYARRLGLEVAIIYKKRKKAGEIEDMTLIGEVEGKNVLIVDDMIDTAGTLCKAAELLQNRGAKEVWACATHGIFSKDAIEKINNSCFKKIIITDSIPQKGNEKIEIVGLVDLFAETIYRISHGLSVSELFK